MSTHGHYPGEFGAQQMTKKLEKDPAYRAARAEHFANEAQTSNIAHAHATSAADRGAHALVAAHAQKMAAKHMRAAAELAPGSEHAQYAKMAHDTAEMAHNEVKAREKTGAVVATTADAVAKAATKAAFAKTNVASDNPTMATQHAAAEAHRAAKIASEKTGDVKTVALHEKMQNHHTNRAETIPLDGSVDKYAKGRTATAQAKELSIKAEAHPSINSHMAAAAAHKLAAATGQPTRSQGGWHMDQYNKHEDAAHKIAAGKGVTRPSPLENSTLEKSLATYAKAAEREQGNPDATKTTRAPVVSSAELSAHLAKTNAHYSETPTQKAPGPTAASMAKTMPIPAAKLTPQKSDADKKYEDVSAKAIALSRSALSGAEHQQAMQAHAKASAVATDDTLSALHHDAAAEHQTARDTIAKQKSVRGPTAAQSLRRSLERSVDNARNISGRIEDATREAEVSRQVSSEHISSMNRMSGLGYERSASQLNLSTPMPSTIRAMGPTSHSDAHLASIIHETLSKTPESARFGDRKVFTHEVYRAMDPGDRAKFGMLDQFKDKLRDLHMGGHVVLSRADLVAAMDSKQVAASHVNIENVGHHTLVGSTPHANFVTSSKPIASAEKPVVASSAHSHGLQVGHVIEHHGEEGTVVDISPTHVRVMNEEEIIAIASKLKEKR